MEEQEAVNQTLEETRGSLSETEVALAHMEALVQVSAGLGHRISGCCYFMCTSLWSSVIHTSPPLTECESVPCRH